MIHAVYNTFKDLEESYRRVGQKLSKRDFLSQIIFKYDLEKRILFIDQIRKNPDSSKVEYIVNCIDKLQQVNLDLVVDSTDLTDLVEFTSKMGDSYRLIQQLDNDLQYRHINTTRGFDLLTKESIILVTPLVDWEYLYIKSEFELFIFMEDIIESDFRVKCKECLKINKSKMKDFPFVIVKDLSVLSNLNLVTKNNVIKIVDNENKARVFVL